MEQPVCGVNADALNRYLIGQGDSLMRVGVVFPQIESGTDPGFIREYTQAAEELGYKHILAYDHVLGASLKNRPDWTGPYSSVDVFHEPFVLFGYMAGIASDLEFVTGVTGESGFQYRRQDQTAFQEQVPPGPLSEIVEIRVRTEAESLDERGGAGPMAYEWDLRIPLRNVR
jgi:hypothetical protein